MNDYQSKMFVCVSTYCADPVDRLLIKVYITKILGAFINFVSFAHKLFNFLLLVLNCSILNLIGCGIWRPCLICQARTENLP